MEQEVEWKEKFYAEVTYEFEEEFNKQIRWRYFNLRILVCQTRRRASKTGKWA